MSTDDQPISVFAMARDPRLRRLFALVGRSLAEGSIEHVWAFEDVLLDIAPEYLPPDVLGGPDDDSEEVQQWNVWIDGLLEGVPGVR